MRTRRIRAGLGLAASAAVVATIIIVVGSQATKPLRPPAEGAVSAKAGNKGGLGRLSPSATQGLAATTALVWTEGGLPQGFARALAASPDVVHVVSVVSGTAWLTASFAGDGALVDHPPAGFAIPIEVTGADPRAYSSFLLPGERNAMAGLAGPRGLLGTSSASLRRLGSEGRLVFGRSSITVAGVLPDTAIGASELFVSKQMAMALGIRREAYVLVEPAPRVSELQLEKAVRSLLPAGTLFRVRERGQTPYFRQADAVLPQVLVKELVGEFSARRLSGGTIEIDPAWVSRHIVKARLPIVGKISCNRILIPLLDGALREIGHDGLTRLISASDFGGCFSSRFIGHDSTSGLSRHSWGAAIDFNVSTNQVGERPHMDPRVVAIFRRWGFTWGGAWLQPDGMHFELLNIP